MAAHASSRPQPWKWACAARWPGAPRSEDSPTTSDAPEATIDTIFDLASLTKVIATATLAMRAVDEHLIQLDDPVAQLDPGVAWRRPFVSHPP